VAPLLLPLITGELRHSVNKEAIKREVDAAEHRAVCGQLQSDRLQAPANMFRFLLLDHLQRILLVQEVRSRLLFAVRELLFRLVASDAQIPLVSAGC